MHAVGDGLLASRKFYIWSALSTLSAFPADLGMGSVDRFPQSHSDGGECSHAQ